MGGVGNGAAEEDWCWDFNPGKAVILGLFGALQLDESWNCAALGCALLPRGLGIRRDFAWKKGVKEFLLVGHENVPHGFGLTGDRSGDTAEGTGTEGLPESRTSTSFPEIRYPRLGRGRRKDCVHLWVF